MLIGSLSSLGGMFSGAQAAGAVGASGLLATLESAAMGGYGVGIVAGTVQGVGTAALAAAGGLGLLDKEETVMDEEVVDEKQ